MGELQSLEERMIPKIVDDAIQPLKQGTEQSLVLAGSTELVVAVLQQWMISYLCKRLLQLMTPEALVTNHKKIPSHYISHYLNCQSHFNLKDLIVRFHSNVTQEWNPRYDPPQYI